jgi:ferredoxin-like protein FixX
LRYENAAQHLVGVFANLVHCSRKLYAACLAAPTGVDLCLDDPKVTTEFLRCLDCGVRRVSRNAARYRDAVFGKQPLGLVFVKIH